jgi:hypothetical protein
MLCTTTSLYWYQPDRTEMDAYGDLHPVRRAGNAAAGAQADPREPPGA